MRLFSNKKNLGHGCLKIDEITDFLGRIIDVTLWYYPNIDKCGLSDWQSKINFEIQSYDENKEIEKVRIWEFQSRKVNQGYGSIVLQEFFNYFVGKQNQSILVVGELSDIDERYIKNQQLRNYVYQKFGFEIDNKWVKRLIE